MSTKDIPFPEDHQDAMARFVRGHRNQSEALHKIYYACRGITDDHRIDAEKTLDGSTVHRLAVEILKLIHSSEYFESHALEAKADIENRRALRCSQSPDQSEHNQV